MTRSVRRRIAVFTGNRAEYGLLVPVLRALEAREDVEMQLVVGGAHLDAQFGATREEIRQDGFAIAGEIAMHPGGDDLYGTAQAIGHGVLNVSHALRRLHPDLLVVYADRFEGFAATIAGTQMRIPTAHIEGGDLTEGGALDDAVRHAMTKLAHLHFTTNQQATNRLLWMGEEPWRVHTVGMAVLDLVARGDFPAPEDVAARYRLQPDQPLVVFTQHSVTTEFDLAAAQLAPSLEALERLANGGAQVVLTYSNNDAGGQRIVEDLRRFAARHSRLIQLRPSVGRADYHGLLHLCGRAGRGACVGNSSSGIKETPAFGCPAVNIGSRQDGRLRADNVLDVGYDADQITAACRRALWDEAFRAQCRRCDNPYGGGQTGPMIAEILAAVPLDARLIRKRMTLDGRPLPADVPWLPRAQGLREPAGTAA